MSKPNPGEIGPRPEEIKKFCQNNFIQRIEGDGSVLYDEMIDEFGSPIFLFPRMAMWYLPFQLKNSLSHYYIRLFLDKDNLQIEVLYISGSSFSDLRLFPKLLFKNKELLNIKPITDFIIRQLNKYNLEPWGLK